MGPLNRLRGARAARRGPRASLALGTSPPAPLVGLRSEQIIALVEEPIRSCPVLVSSRILAADTCLVYCTSPEGLAERAPAIPAPSPGRETPTCGLAAPGRRFLPCHDLLLGRATRSPMLNERPYFQLSIEELEALFNKSGGVPDHLAAIAAELAHRSTRRARALRERVEAALQTMSKPDRKLGRTAAPSRNQADGEYRAWNFDPDQLAIIRAPADRRCIVNAPPGTGKTAVACGRIAFLLEQGIAPHRIWLVSFTRTAVQELRNRIEELAVDRADVYGVRVTTLDSRAWQLVQGFTGRGGEVLRGNYESTIADAIALIRSGHEAVNEVLGELAHVIIDEAQDLVGDRATLLEEIVRRVPANCGITILTDDAQAIYGFTEEEESIGDGLGTLSERLRRSSPGEFVESELRKVYRTGSPTLERLFVEVRSELLSAIRRDAGRSLFMVRERIHQYRDGDALTVTDDPPSPGTLVLFRTRFEVLEASSRLAQRGVPHRIRMSGTPHCLHPWLAIAFQEPSSNRLSRQEFERRWALVERIFRPDPAAVDRAWTDMRRLAGEGSIVRMDLLREMLSRSRPPIEFVTPELGLSGPILSTIHASKGREAEVVRLMLPLVDGPVEVPDEEARVLFVGATRARASLHVGTGFRYRTKPTARNRRSRLVWGREHQPMRAQVEIGLDGDVDVRSPVGVDTQTSDSDAAAAQQWLIANLERVSSLRLWRGRREEEYRYTVRVGESPDATVLGRLTAEFGDGLFDAARLHWPTTRVAPPRWIGPVACLTARSVVLPPDSEDETTIHRPWRDSGFWLAPVVVGLPTLPFRRVRS